MAEPLSPSDRSSLAAEQGPVNMAVGGMLVFERDRPLTRDMILNSVWGYQSFPNTRTVDAHVVKLRQKLEPDPNAPRHFLTVHGVGYRFVP